jgi:hypothetical protein
MSDSINLMIRGYGNGKLQFADRIVVPEAQLDTLMKTTVERHAKALAKFDLTMIEIEFLDEPNPNERFFRFGSDPAGMVKPMAIKLGKTK